MAGIFPTLYPSIVGITAFIVTAFTLFEVKCSLLQSQMMKRQDQVKDHSIIATISTASMVECALECQRNPLCTDVAHSRASETCQLLGRKKEIEPAKVIKSDGKVSVFTNIVGHNSRLEGKYALVIGLQWNLSITNMLHSGHLSIADTIFRNHLPIFYLNLPLVSGHISITDTIFKNHLSPL